jgi:RNA polymerase sigma factor (sigma-70 family)
MYEREFATVFRAVLLLCGDRAAAEDATQEAFAGALVRWGRLAGQPWAAGWVTTTAMNVARRAMRRRPALPEEPFPPAVDRDARLDVRAAIRELPPRQQEAIALYYLLDLSVLETAAAMGVSEGAVKTHLARGRRALGSTLGVSDEGEPAVELEPDRSDDPASGTGSRGRAHDD